jgi:NADH:ubiquinone oxidoreductase subunit K
MISKFLLLNGLVFSFSLAGLINNARHFLLYMVSLEIMYLSIVCAFATVSVIVPFSKGVIISLFCLGLAAGEAVVGFFFAVDMFTQKQILFLLWFFQLKG